jgi:hypothetical protein
MYINNYALNLTSNESVSIETDFGKAILNKINIGSLKLKTGKLIATDPILLYDDQAFSIKVMPGDYTVFAYVADFENGEKVTTLSKVEFSKETPVRWTMALYDGENSNNLKNDEFLGFDVENGICAYMDESVMEELDMLFEDDLEKYEDSIRSSVKFSKKAFSFKDIPYGKNNCNILAFSSGLKVGTFPSYFGYDKNNKICCLVTDFMVLS